MFFECRKKPYPQKRPHTVVTGVTPSFLSLQTRWISRLFDYCLASSAPSVCQKSEEIWKVCALLARCPPILHLTVTEEAGNKTASSSNVRFQEPRNSLI